MPGVIAMSFLKSKKTVRGASSRKSATAPSRRLNWSVLLRGVMLAVLLLVCVGLYQLGAVLLSQPITRVVVKGDFRQIDRKTVIAEVEPFLLDGFVRLKLTDIRQQLLQHPWIFDVVLERHWPDEILIVVTEQTAIARWGDSAYLNHRGELFEPLKQLDDTEKLPRLYGPDNSAEQVMNHFRELGDVLSQENLKLAELRLSDRGDWSLCLDNGIAIVLGAGEVMEKMRRFLTVYQRSLSADFFKVEKIDMRYSNGFAVAWKDS
jgi:cell division protein FtsQ